MKTRYRGRPLWCSTGPHYCLAKDSVSRGRVKGGSHASKNSNGNSVALGRSDSWRCARRLCSIRSAQPSVRPSWPGGPLVDPNLVNAWGLSSGATTPWWISDNGTGRTTLYNVGLGTVQLVFTVPGAMGQQGTPTGQVRNGGTGFVIDNGVGAPAPARFIIAGEDGTISGFKGVPIVIKVPNTTGAVYKGLAIDSITNGKFLYATDFHNGRVDVFDSNWTPVHTPGAFVDPKMQKGFAPFGIQAIQIGTQTQIFVTYAKQDDVAHDDVAGQSHGFVSRFSTDGTFLGRVATRGQLNSPWGLALAP